MGSGSTHAFDDAGSHAGYGPLYLFVARGAHDERASWINGREERIAVLEAMLDIPTNLEALGCYPLEFISLYSDQHHVGLRKPNEGGRQQKKTKSMSTYQGLCLFKLQLLG